MLVIPEIDLSRGRCVRLTDSGYEEERVYFVEPVLMARLWRVMNAKALHVVDVDAEGRAAGRDNSAVIGDIARALDIPVQVEGGVVTPEQVETLLGLGAYRVVLSPAYAGGAAGVEEAVARFGASRVAAGLRAGGAAADSAADLEGRGVRRFVYHDADAAGGPDLAAYRAIASRLEKARLTAEGGVMGYRDLLALAGVGPPLDSVIVGRALYENRFPCQQFWAWHEKETLDLERFSTAPLADEGR